MEMIGQQVIVVDKNELKTNEIQPSGFGY